MQPQTPIQERIERVVTNGLGYSVCDDRRFFKRMHSVPPKDTAEDLQLHLQCMEVAGLSMEEILKNSEIDLVPAFFFDGSRLVRGLGYSGFIDPNFTGEIRIEPSTNPDPAKSRAFPYQGLVRPVPNRRLTDRQP